MDGPRPERSGGSGGWPGYSHEGGKVADEFGRHGQRIATKGRGKGCSSNGQSKRRGIPTQQHAPASKAAILQSSRQTTYELPSPSPFRCHDHHIHHGLHNSPAENKRALSHNPLIQGCLKGTPSTSRISPHPSPSSSIATLFKYFPNPETSTVLESSTLISQQRKCNQQDMEHEFNRRTRAHQRVLARTRGARPTQSRQIRERSCPQKDEGATAP